MLQQIDHKIKETSLEILLKTFYNVFPNCLTLLLNIHKYSFSSLYTKLFAAKGSL